MSQLKMYRLKGTPERELTLPEGYSFSFYKDESDMMPWVECCRQGLVADDANEQVFIDRIREHKDIDMSKDVIFLDYGSEHIGTVTAIDHKEDGNWGEMHMLGIRPDFRGKGLGKYMNNAAVKKLMADGVEYVMLTTDEWRKSAVKSYLTSGFLPVEYDEGMKERWEAVLEEYGIYSVNMVNEDASFCRKVYRASAVKARERSDGKIKIGVLGARRGRTMMNYCKAADNAVLVAVCDSYAPSLESVKETIGDSVTYYTDFEEFLHHDMDAVVLANYANEHAPYAIRCMESGKDVLSEVLPVQTMAEAVALAECVERTGRVYAYAENYCYMPAPREMRRLYREGKLGEFEYGEGEYMHNCEPGWAGYSLGLPEHWRNTMYATFYCTHSIGPLIHISGLRPVSVTAFELPFNERMKRMGAKAGNTAIEIITLENGAMIKSLHGVGCSKCSVWYSMYGTKGIAESSREASGFGGVQRIYTEYDDTDVAYSGANHFVASYEPTDELSEYSGRSGHGGSDYYTMYFFAEKLLGNPDAEIVDIYEALDMFLPGILGYQSVLKGGIPQSIPDFRDPKQRESFRNDTACTDPAVAGDMLIPSYSKGNPDIPEENYRILRKRNEENQKKK